MTWIIFAAIVVLLLGGLVAYSRISNPSIDVSAIDANAVVSASDQDGNIGDHVRGSADAKVVIVEYGDFQCPYCGNIHPATQTITSLYGDSIAFVFRNFPLATLHPNARAASAAAEAAGLQGKYWEMHDTLYEGQSAWEGAGATERTAVFNGYAEQLDLDLAKFQEDLSNASVNKKISFDQALGKKLNVTATPTMYLNGTKLTEEITAQLQSGDTSGIKALINAELKKAGVAVPAAAIEE